jgi:hypothetical protein
MLHTMPRTLALGLVAGALLAASPSVAAPVFFNFSLSGPAEEPPNASPGTGTATVSLDTVAHVMTVQATFSGSCLAHDHGAHPLLLHRAALHGPCRRGRPRCPTSPASRLT